MLGRVARFLNFQVWTGDVFFVESAVKLDSNQVLVYKKQQVYCHQVPTPHALKVALCCGSTKSRQPAKYHLKTSAAFTPSNILFFQLSY